MPVTYNRTWWKNHIVRRSRTYTEVTNTDGSRTDTPAPGEIFQQGTPLNEANLNNMEQGISDCAGAINNLEEVKIEEVIYRVPVQTSGWDGAQAPYTKTITVNGITANDIPIIDIQQFGAYALDANIRASWSAITRIVTGNNSLTLTAEAIPTTDFYILVRCLR